jgi:hypothetical protein
MRFPDWLGALLYVAVALAAVAGAALLTDALGGPAGALARGVPPPVPWR